jgi:type II secretory ATPase GspE/PulE/Tfp pilus assembly ATPase PilB-like protein
MAKHRADYLSMKDRATDPRRSSYQAPVITAPTRVVAVKATGLPYVVPFEKIVEEPVLETKPVKAKRVRVPKPERALKPVNVSTLTPAAAPAEPRKFPAYRPPKRTTPDTVVVTEAVAVDANVSVATAASAPVEPVEPAEPVDEASVEIVALHAEPATVTAEPEVPTTSLLDEIEPALAPLLPAVTPAVEPTPAPVQIVVVPQAQQVIYSQETPPAGMRVAPAPVTRVAPVLPTPVIVTAPAPHQFTAKDLEDQRTADLIHTLPPEKPLELLPDVRTFKGKPEEEEKKVKEPIFVWRGKPIGSAARANAEKTTVDAPKKSSKSVAAERPDFDPSTESIDARHWFEDAMEYSLDRGASDLHVVLDPKTSTLTARMRVDGMMQEFAVITGEDAKIIMGKFKSAAGLASNGSFVPEEALYDIEIDGETRKARVASFRDHTMGDALVLRLPPTGELRALEELGFGEQNLALFHKLLRAANRMVLIAGPMGSGKTTTAHAALKKVTTTERTVWSVEDPVERDLPGVIQLEIDEKNGAGFEALLPVLVRSDYDTLFLGEIRDKATAAAGVRQAKAGRQVISTIHANDNVTAILRLIELAQDSPLSCMDAVRGVVSQRLMRRLNPAWDGVDPSTRYKGRVPVHEVLIINDELTEAVMRDRPIKEIKEIAGRASESTFKKDSERLIAAGITDRAEVDRVLGEEENDDD